VARVRAPGRRCPALVDLAELAAPVEHSAELVGLVDLAALAALAQRHRGYGFT